MQDKQKNRWNELIKTSEYIERLKVIEDYVRNLSKQTDTSYYTPHDASHCLAVEKMVKTLIKKSGVSGVKLELSDLENFILFSAVWTHDLGMFHSIATEFFNAQKIPIRSPRKIRDIHDEISAWRVSCESGEILRISNEGRDKESKAAVDSRLRNYAHTINVISQFHRMKTDIEDCPKERFLKEEKVRTRLLACLLRLGDTLHVDSSRFDRRLYDILQIGQLDRSTRLHWLKSYVVSNVYLDPTSETVFIYIDLPAHTKSPHSNEVDWGVSSEDLKTAITNGVLEDIIAVRETFIEYKIPAYSLVKTKVAYVPGYSKNEINEIAGVINDLGIAFSPNTSKVIEKACDSVTSLCDTDFERSEHYYNQMNQLISYLQEMYDSRPCHVGLGKIIGTVGEAFELPTGDLRGITNTNVKTSQDAIRGAIEKIKKEKDEYVQNLYNKDAVLGGIKNIILFAYSETVINFLEKYGKQHPEWKDKLKLFVFECSGKRRLASNNDIEYNDGLHYALQLSKHNFKNIHLLPDTSFGSLVYNFKHTCLFSWPKDGELVGAKDCEFFKKYLKDHHDISWLESAEIKEYDEKHIRIAKDDDTFAEITLNEEEKKAIIRIGDDKIDDLILKEEENGVKSIHTVTDKIDESLVLFGVNGISEKGDCGHSSGHLMIAIVAKRCGIPVRVIADSFKIGKIDWRPAAKRDTPWLTGQRKLINDLKKHNIKLINYLEDKIPKELIDEIITDKEDNMWQNQ